MKALSLIPVKIRLKEDWERNLFFLALSQFIVMAGMNACVPFLPLYIRELGVSGESAERFWSGMVFAGPYFLSVIFVPIWGNLGDRYGRKLMIIRAILGLSLAMFLMGFARDVWQLFLLRVFQGATSGFIAANLGFTVANTPSDRKGYAVGFLQSSHSAGSIVGPLVGGFVSDLFGFRVVFFLVAMLSIISAILISAFVKEINKIHNEHTEGVLKTFRQVASTPSLRYPMIMIILGQIGIFMTFPLMPFYLEYLGAPKGILSTLTGIVVGVAGVFNIVFAPIWGKWSDRKEIGNLIRKSSLILSLAMFLHAVAFNYLLIIPLRVVVGICLAGLVPLLYTYLGKIVDPEKVGSIMGFASSANLFGSLLAFLGTALISPNLSLPLNFVISSAVLLIVFAFTPKLSHKKTDK
ncbi:MFS transporter [Bacteroidetes/Chlorobi group bacterium MS-B_bin-24]|nr:MAG: MFS transporter [Bacteroidetes/Chlorobi group bacterium MS-B_bin-24]